MAKKYKNEQTILEFIVLGIFKLLWWLITLPFKGLKRGSASRFSIEEKNYITGKRLEIEALLGSESVIELKHAVMEADKLVDYTLKAKGYVGETFADRLRAAQKSMPAYLYDQLWRGHKVRNQIAHEQELRIQNLELREAAKKLLSYLRQL
jgi:hypothetical protein